MQGHHLTGTGTTLHYMGHTVPQNVRVCCHYAWAIILIWYIIGWCSFSSNIRIRVTCLITLQRGLDKTKNSVDFNMNVCAGCQIISTLVRKYIHGINTRDQTSNGIFESTGTMVTEHCPYCWEFLDTHSDISSVSLSSFTQCRFLWTRQVTLWYGQIW